MPCICREHTADPSTPALDSDEAITCCCEGPLGAVRVLERPSWFTDEPSRAVLPADHSLTTATAVHDSLLT